MPPGSTRSGPVGRPIWLLMDPRITLLPPGSAPVAGRDAVLEWMGENAAEIASLRATDPMIDVQGDLATLVGGWSWRSHGPRPTT